MPVLPHFLAHDAAYGAELMDRGAADQRLLAGMEAEGVNWFKREAVYRAVRGFGGAVWARHTPAGVSLYRYFCRLVGEEEHAALSGSRFLRPRP